MRFSLVLMLLVVANTQAQVGIGTSTPSSAAMLEISSSTDSVHYFGFLPPRVANTGARDLIPASIQDVGLLVFVESTGSLSVWNGIGWEDVYVLSTTISPLVQQDFDTALSWTYTSSPSFYAVGNDIFDVTSSLGSGDTAAIDNVSGNFVGFRDLDNPNGGGNFNHELQFDNVDVSGLSNPRIAFNWDVFEFDNGDDLMYQVFFDNVGQGIVTLFSGSSSGSGISGQGNELITVPASVTLVRLTVMVNQNGDADFAALDNFVIYGN